MDRSALAAIALLGCPFAAQSLSTEARADDTASLTIKNHHFEPHTLSVKANTKIAISVTNAGTEPAEFESSELNREKVVPPGKTVTIYVGPLAPGTYPFFDDFDQAATGQIVAK